MDELDHVADLNAQDDDGLGWSTLADVRDLGSGGFTARWGRARVHFGRTVISQGASDDAALVRGTPRLATAVAFGGAVGPVLVAAGLNHAPAMVIRRDVQGHLDVAERVIEVIRRDELVGQAQRIRVAQRRVGRR